MTQIKSKTPFIYEINTATFLTELTVRFKRDITFANVPDEVWSEISRKGVDMIWFMGVWQRSKTAEYMARNQPWIHEALPDATDRDILGSAYSIATYNVDDRFGGDEGLAIARKQLDEKGISLMLDYVPNHMAIDHPWVIDHPEYFLLGTEDEYSAHPDHFVKTEHNIFANAKDPNFPPWSDVLQLNALSSELREAVQLTVMKIASQCDGVRCDMAMLMLNDVFKQTWGERVGERPYEEFWHVLIQAVRSVHPDFIFVAEVYWNKESKLLDLGFDLCYDKDLYDALVEGDAGDVSSHLRKTKMFQDSLLRFIENHDEERAAQMMPLDRHKAAATIMASLPGASMYYEGQFEGYRRRVPVQLGRRYEEPRDDRIVNFYNDLLTVFGSQRITDGEWQRYAVRSSIFSRGYGNLLSWSWSNDTHTFVVVVNFSSGLSKGRLDVDRSTTKQDIQTVFGVVDFKLKGHELRINAAPWSHAVLKLSKK